MRWPYRALSTAFGVADAVVPKALPPSTSPDALIDAAGTNPAPSAREGLRQLITAIDAESKLTVFGKVSLRWDMIRLLRNAQQIEDAQDNQAIATAPVQASIFILDL